ncbi:hypothetical protein TWF481_004833 [Arthrobotrys musiformis]|uniref:Uncharacterized protein n=1 Tax=Arthrobotrys musiformis TaxID=47236 RepID=A0AAV9WKQ2_9PEZI
MGPKKGKGKATGKQQKPKSCNAPPTTTIHPPPSREPSPPPPSTLNPEATPYPAPTGIENTPIERTIPPSLQSLSQKWTTKSQELATNVQRLITASTQSETEEIHETLSQIAKDLIILREELTAAEATNNVRDIITIRMGMIDTLKETKTTLEGIFAKKNDEREIERLLVEGEKGESAGKNDVQAESAVIEKEKALVREEKAENALMAAIVKEEKVNVQQTITALDSHVVEVDEHAAGPSMADREMVRANWEAAKATWETAKANWIQSIKEESGTVKEATGLEKGGVRERIAAINRRVSNATNTIVANTGASPDKKKDATESPQTTKEGNIANKEPANINKESADLKKQDAADCEPPKIKEEKSEIKEADTTDEIKEEELSKETAVISGADTTSEIQHEETTAEQFQLAIFLTLPVANHFFYACHFALLPTFLALSDGKPLWVRMCIWTLWALPNFFWDFTRFIRILTAIVVYTLLWLYYLYG